jgi:hypothetical protein
MDPFLVTRARLMSSYFDSGKRRKRSIKSAGQVPSSTSLQLFGNSRTAGRLSSKIIQRVSFGGIGCIPKSRSAAERYGGTSIVLHTHTFPSISCNCVQPVLDIKLDGFDRRQLPTSAIFSGRATPTRGFFCGKSFDENELERYPLSDIIV